MVVVVEMGWKMMRTELPLEVGRGEMEEWKWVWGGRVRESGRSWWEVELSAASRNKRMNSPRLSEVEKREKKEVPMSCDSCKRRMSSMAGPIERMLPVPSDWIQGVGRSRRIDEILSCCRPSLRRAELTIVAKTPPKMTVPERTNG